MDIGRCNGCGEVMAGADLEFMSDRTSTNLVTQKYSAPYPICPFCGSDRIEDVVAKADFLRDQMKEKM